MLVVDHRGVVMSYSMRPGSANDTTVFKGSGFKRNWPTAMPNGTVILGDAGYKLAPYMMTPYDITASMPIHQRSFNRVHSATRMKVECAIGKLTGRFTILQRALDQACDGTGRQDIIRACIVLHNIVTTLSDTVEIAQEPVIADVVNEL